MTKYHILLRLTHWTMGLCILGLIGLGWYMVDLKPEEGKYALYGWHKMFGMLIIFLYPIRVLLRWKTEIPELPEGIKPRDRKLSHAVHILLYFGMIAIPVSGYVMSSAGGYPVNFFFGITVPDLIGKNKELGGIAHEAHWILAYSVLAIVALHVAGALKHRFFEPKENDVIRRML